MNAFANHFSFEFFTGLRNRGLLMLNYLFPLAFYAMMGLMMVSINPFFLEVMIPSMIVFAVLSGTILGLPQPLVDAREAGIFRSYMVNGVPAASVLVIPALTAVIHVTAASTIITITAPLAFGAAMPANWLGFVLTGILLAFASAGLGVLIGVISSNSRMTVLWSQLVYLPSILLSGMMVPSSLLPAILRRLGRLLPGTYAMESFKGWSFGQPVGFAPLWSVVVLLAGGIAAFGVADYLFSWDSRNVARRSPLLGLLALLPYAIGAALLP